MSSPRGSLGRVIALTASAIILVVLSIPEDAILKPLLDIIDNGGFGWFVTVIVAILMCLDIYEIYKLIKRRV